jgi:hypothetical protein
MDGGVQVVAPAVVDLLEEVAGGALDEADFKSLEPVIGRWNEGTLPWADLVAHVTRFARHRHAGNGLQHRHLTRALRTLNKKEMTSPLSPMVVENKYLKIMSPVLKEGFISPTHSRQDAAGMAMLAGTGASMSFIAAMSSIIVLKVAAATAKQQMLHMKNHEQLTHFTCHTRDWLSTFTFATGTSSTTVSFPGHHRANETGLAIMMLLISIIVDVAVGLMVGFFVYSSFRKSVVNDDCEDELNQEKVERLTL